MGRIFERFNHIQFHNEAEVSQNLVVPLFNEFLGYDEREILPERQQPTVEIPRNRNKKVPGDDAKIRPDYMVALGGNHDRIVFSFDSKGPNESLDDHLDQLLAYCISVGNLVATTNGSEFRVYNARELVFQSLDITALDLQFSELRKLLHKDVAHHSVTERIRSLNDDLALGRGSNFTTIKKREHIALQNSDFLPYLEFLSGSSAELTLPPAIFEIFDTPLRLLPAQQIYNFLPLRSEFDLKPDEPRTYRHITQELHHTPILIVGESGIGKTSLLAQITREQSSLCLHYESNLIPVTVKLSHYTVTNNLRQLILDSFSGKGISISTHKLNALLREGRLILLLDAFDEVVDKYLHDLQQEIGNILANFNCPTIITTRHFRLPQLSPLTKYEIAPLSWAKIQEFSEMYLGDKHLDFLNEAISKGLGQLASNTLLLTLLILLYQHNQNLPHSQTQVLETIVDHLEEWSQSKTQRFSQPLPWQIKLNALAELAFLSFINGETYLLDAELAEEASINLLNQLEARRVIIQGLLLPDFYEQLTDTGLILFHNGNVSFWHRAFQEYLASLQISSKVQSGEIQISRVIRNPKWESMLPVVAHHTQNVDGLIHDLLLHNVFTAGRAIVECNLSSGEVYEQTANCLMERCSSNQRAIRHLAVNLLRQIEGEFVGKKFQELLEADQIKANCELEHIRKIALIEIAKRNIPNGRELVYSHLDWHSYTRLNWMNQEAHAGASVIEALSWFDDEESQQHIVNRWITKRDMPTRDACKDALLRVEVRSGLSSKIKDQLLDLVIGESSSQNQPLNIVQAEDAERIEIDYWGMESVLIAVHDIQQALHLIDVLEATDDLEVQSRCLRILKTFSEPEITKTIIQKIESHKTNLQVCERFLDVLSESGGDVPIDVFKAFASDAFPSTAKAYAIRGLRNFPFARTKDIVLLAVHPPPYEQLLEATQTFLIEQALQTHTDSEILDMLADFMNSPNLSNDTCEYLQILLTECNNALSLLHQLAKPGIPADVEWNILTNLESLPSKTLQKAIDQLISPLPYQFLLDTPPCDYGRIQNEIFHLLDKHGQIPLLAKTEYQPEFLNTLSLETLFTAIRRDKIYEMEAYVIGFIEKRIENKEVRVQRKIVEAAWILADLGNIEKAQDIVEPIIQDVANVHDWVLGDVLKGIHLLPSEYAILQIEKIWAAVEGKTLLPTYCIEALERIGTQSALDMLTRIAQETSEEEKFRSEPERALRAIQRVSPSGREDWLINFLSQEHKDRHSTQRAIDMLGLLGSKKALPIIEQYFNNDPNEKIRFVAFWAIHNIYKAGDETWYNGEERGCI